MAALRLVQYFLSMANRLKVMAKRVGHFDVTAPGHCKVTY